MIAFLDLVGTLGDRQWMPVGQVLIPRKGWQVIWSFDRGKYAYWCLRPSTIPFLEALRARGLDLAILSSSGEQETFAFMEEAGIRSWFSAVYGRDSQIPLPAGPWILVEDRDQEPYPELHPGPHYKVLQVVGLNRPGQSPVENETLSRTLIERHMIKSATYAGEGEDICPLPCLLTEIDSKLAAQA